MSSIPTISGVVSEAAEAISDSFVQEPPVNTWAIVQNKFKDNEKVMLIFEAYQFVGQEYSSRLLALVASEVGCTYAIFALRYLRVPPRNSGDITIDNLFPINHSFQIRTDKKGTISQLQFELKNLEESATPAQYYYYPKISLAGASDFETFYTRIKAVQKTMTMDIHGAENLLSYSWLNDYRQIGEVKQELKRREHEYIVYKNISIYCATWNVNNKSSYDSPLHLWLSACANPPDIYAIALQELDATAKAITFSENRRDPIWIQKMLESAHPQAEYEELDSVRLVGMQLTLLIRKPLRVHVARCRVKSIARGVLNTLGNKGGVAISLQLFEGNFCFVNSHLAAHMHFVETRNADYWGIAKGIDFDDELRRNINDHE